VAFSLLEHHMTPIHPIVAALVARLNEDLREAFEERAGIMQYEAGHARELAEALALLDVIRTNRFAASAVTVWRIEFDGQALTVLTTDPELARKHFADIGATPAGPVDLAQAVRDIGVAAVLTHLG
jgi:hypothetical protein